MSQRGPQVCGCKAPDWSCGLRRRPLGPQGTLCIPGLGLLQGGARGVRLWGAWWHRRFSELHWVRGCAPCPMAEALPWAAQGLGCGRRSQGPSCDFCPRRAGLRQWHQARPTPSVQEDQIVAAFSPQDGVTRQIAEQAVVVEQ